MSSPTSDSTWTLAPQRHRPTDALDATAETVLRWLQVSRDVLIRADTGAGRTTCLRKSAALLATAGRNPVVFDHRMLRRTGLGVGARQRPARPETDPVTLLAEDLGRHGVLLVDDLHELDGAALELVEQVLLGTSAQLVATTSRDLLRSPCPRAVPRMLAERGPAEVVIPPLDYQSIAHLVADRLGGEVDAALVSSVTAWSAGNLATVLAVVDSARFAGVIVQHGCRWTLVGEIETVPMDAVAHLLVSGMTEPELAALETLSVVGPTTASDVHRLVPEEVLRSLIEQNRLVVHRGGPAHSSDLVAVSPPALARALGNRLGGTQRMHIADGAAHELGGVRANGTSPNGLGEMLAAESAAGGERTRRWAAQLAALVHERTLVDEGTAFNRWQRAPSVDTALPYLALVMRQADTERASAVFAGTPVTSDDDEAQVDMYRRLEHRWRIWNRPAILGPGEATPLTASVRQGGVVQHVRLAALEGWSDERLEASLVDFGIGDPAPRGPLTRLEAAGALLAAGRLEIALAVSSIPCDSPPWLPDEVHHYFAGIHSMALLLSGRTEDAGAASREALGRAYDELDLAGIRVHSLTLAHALVIEGQHESAWRVLSLALRLGPPGPMGNTFYRRTLTFGAKICAESGSPDIARLLLAELDEVPASYCPYIGTMRAIGEASLLRAEGCDSEADELLWDAGEQCKSVGWLAPAIEYWALRTGATTAAQARTIRETLDRAPAPLFGPLLRVHTAVADGDCAELAVALRSAPLQIVPGLAATGLTVLSAARERAGDEPLAPVDVSDLVGRAVAAQLLNQPAAAAGIGGLSAREREVARRASLGMSNREIAEHFNLSVRTVENHLHRVLQKLGYTNRRQLADVASLL